MACWCVEEKLLKAATGIKKRTNKKTKTQPLLSQHVTVNRLFFRLLLIGPFSRGGEEASLARAALLPWADRGRRRMTHYITSFVEEGSDGT